MNIELMAGKSNQSEMTYGSIVQYYSVSIDLLLVKSHPARAARRGELPTAGSPHEAIAGRYRTSTTGQHYLRLRTTVLSLYALRGIEMQDADSKARFCRSYRED